MRRMLRPGIWISSITGLVATVALLAAVFGNWTPMFSAQTLAAFLFAGSLSLIDSIFTIRNLRIFPYFSSTVGEIETFLSGWCLTQNMHFLDELAIGHDVRTLSSFGFADDLFGETFIWHAAEEGLTTVEFLMKELPVDWTKVNDPDKVLEDLQKLRHALVRARDQQIEFCLVMRRGTVVPPYELAVAKGTPF